MTVYVLPMNAPLPKGAVEVNTTSRSTNWSKGLSPFFVGPVEIYEIDDELIYAKNLENAWQFSKVYKQHVGPDGWPTEKYFIWAKQGWNDTFAHRYPMGKGAIPEYSYWDHGVRMKHGYIEARKRLYAPLYKEAVRKTEAWSKLVEIHKTGVDIALKDFDAFDHRALNMTLDDVLNCETRKMGHAFCLAMMLEKLETSNG